MTLGSRESTNFGTFIMVFEHMLLYISVFHTLIYPYGEALSLKEFDECDNPIENLELQHLHIVFRHGDRTPFDDYLNPPAEFEKHWPSGRGQLSDEGIVQEFELGQWIRENYDEFIPLKYNASDFHLRSTDIDRVLISGQSVAAGIYENATSPLEPYGISWRPIPIHTVKQERDVLLSLAPCPRLNKLRDELMNSQTAIDYAEQHRALFDTMNKNLAYVEVNHLNFWKVYDFFVCMKGRGRQLPEWMSEELFNEMTAMNTFYWNLKFSSTTEIVRLEIGVFINAFISHVKAVTDGTESPVTNGHHLSIQHSLVYSSHDTDVSYVLSAFGASDDQLIEYSGAVVLELLGPDPPASRSDFRLRLRYKRGYPDLVGEYRRLPPCQQLPGEDGCPLDVVLEYLKPIVLTEEEFEVACQLE